MSSLEKAKKYAEITKLKDTIRAIVIDPILGYSKLIFTGATQEEIEKISSKMAEEMSRHLDAMYDISISGIVSTYSDEEMDAAIAFYSSPAGLSYTDKSDGLIKRNQKEMDKYNLAVLMPSLQSAMAKVLAEIEGISEEEALRSLRS